jgi:type I restriction enzyme S subunit
MELKPGYKQTEAGVIPEDWEVSCLGDLAEFITSGSRGWARYYSDSGSLFIRSQNVREGMLDFSDRQYVRPPSGAEGERTGARVGDVLITITGNSVGNVAYLSQNLGNAYVSQHVGLVRLVDANLADYICRYLSPCAPGNPQIEISQSGQSKPGLNLQNLKDFKLAIPTSSVERDAVSNALSDIDSAIELLCKLITKKRDIKQAAVQELLTGKRRLPGFEGEWETTRLGDHMKYLKNGTNSRAELRVDGRVKYLHYGDIHASSLSFISPHDLPSLPVAKAAGLDRLKDGDLIFADASEDISGVSKSVEICDSRDSEVVSGLHTIAARFDKTVLADGFKGFLQYVPSFSAHLRRLAAGTKVYATNRAHISSAEVQLPPVSEQRAIAGVLMDLNKEIAALQERLNKVHLTKEGMMQELLTGRIRLR